MLHVWLAPEVHNQVRNFLCRFHNEEVAVAVQHSEVRAQDGLEGGGIACKKRSEEDAVVATLTVIFACSWM